MTRKSRWWALAALALSMLTIGLDTTVLSVALPTLATDLGASTAQLQWFSTSYTLVLAALLLPAGALGDRYGYKKLLLIALLIFGASSVWCAYSGSADVLILARVMLGIGAALMIPLSMAVLPSIFPDADERSRALTIWVTSTAVGLPLGPIVGGWLLSHAWWGAIFLINVPLVVVGLAAVAAFIPESRAAESRPIDLAGVAVSSAGLTSLTFGFIRVGQESWTDTLALTTIGAGILLLAAFAAWQLRARYPLIDLGLFAVPGFRWATVILTLMGMLMFGVLFALPLLFQTVQGASTLSTGLRLLPLIAGLLVSSRIVDRLGRLLGSGPTIAVGFLLSAAAFAAAVFTTASTPFAVIAAWLVVIGMGMGLVMPTAMNAALDTLPPTRTGSGSALIQALRQAGGTIGVALLGTILNAGYRGETPKVPNPALQHRIDESVSAGVAVAHATGQPQLLAGVQSAFVHGISSMFTVCAATSAVLAIVAVVAFRPRATGRHHARPGQPGFPDARESIYAGR
jgi:EmrB/QacA subfamily drug resistance transporter